jgi:threonine dehydrogenase-like Zn-dependent dehydrogenase
MTAQKSSSGTMRRVVVSTGRIDVVRADVPQPGPGEVLVRSVLAGVCGSDTHAAAGLHPWISLPYVPGHEVVGVVAETGAGVSSVQPGRRVTVEPYLPCWHCKQCLRGQENICENLGFLGCRDPQGATADYFTVDSRRSHVLPDELDDRAAALIEPSRRRCTRSGSRVGSQGGRSPQAASPAHIKVLLAIDPDRTR